MAKGGKTNAQMKKMGRNLAKIANQNREVRKVQKDMADAELAKAKLQLEAQKVEKIPTGLRSAR